MPPPPFLLYSGIGILAAILCITLLASLLTLIASWVLLRLYRRSVKKWMAASAAPDQQYFQDNESAAVAKRERTVRNAGDSADRLFNGSFSEPWRYARRYAGAGVLYALIIAACGYYAFSQIPINALAAAHHPLQFLFLLWTFLWPAVLIVQSIALTAARLRYLLPGLYFLSLGALGMLTAWTVTEAALPASNMQTVAWSGETPVRLLGKWILYNGAPTLLIVAFRSRHVRAVAPMMLSFMTVVSFGLLGAYVAPFYYKDASLVVLDFALDTLRWTPGWTLAVYFALLALVACLLFGIAGAWVMKRIRAGYERKTISDQSLALDSLWLLFAAFYTAILAFAGIGWVILSVAAAVLYQIALRVGRKLTVKNVRHERGPALLILRVFSLGKRSEALFDAVSRHWRYLGSVQLIAGPDLAISTAAPHRFLTFLSGKLRALFVTHRLAIESCLTVLDTERDADGRFRMNDFFCHADTWQRLLSELVSGTDAVLMDLRSFSKTNDGCVFEINELLKHVPLPRLVFLTDATTKQEFLHETFDSGCRRLPEGSPNFGIAASDIQPLNLDSLQYSSLKELLRRLCSAAAWRDVTVVEA